MEEQKFSLTFARAFLYCLLWLALPALLMYIIVAFLGWQTTGTSFYALDAILSNTTVSVVVSVLGLLLTLILITRGDFSKLQIRLVGKSNLLYLLGTILFAFGLSILVSELDNIFRAFVPLTETWQLAFGELNSMPWHLYLIEVVITAPIVEELFVRGVIARGLSNRYSKTKAIIFTAILFGFIHLNVWQFVAAFVGGLYLTWLYLTTDSMLLVMLAHALHNGVDLLVGDLLQWSVPGYNAPGIGALGHQPLWFDLTGLALVLVGALIFRLAGSRNRLPDSGDYYMPYAPDQTGRTY